MVALTQKPKLNPKDGRVYLGDVALTHSEENYLKYNRHFTREGSEFIHDVMVKIGKDDLYARDPFLKAIQPFVDRTATRIAGQVYGEQVDAERVKEVTQDVLIELIQKPEYFQGSARSWTNFSQRIQSDLRSKFSVDKDKKEHEQNAKVLLSADSTVASDEGNPQTVLFAKQRANIVRKIIDDYSSSRRAEKVLKLRYGIDTGSEGHDLETIARMYDLTRQRIRQIEDGAIKELKRSTSTRKQLESLFSDDLRFTTTPPQAISQQRKSTEGYWQEKTGKEQAHRNEIRSLFKRPDGWLSHDDELRSVFKISDNQWHALMIADLSRHHKSCEILHTQGFAITKKLFAALEDANMGPLNTDADAYKHNLLVDSIAGIMKIAREDKSISR